MNSRTWKTLKSTVVIFQALKPLQPHWPQRPLQPNWPQQPLKPNFPKKLHKPGTKITNTGDFLWNGSSKIQFFTDFSTFSVGGCYGQPMLLFWKLIHESQISKPPEATMHHNLTKLTHFRFTKIKFTKKETKTKLTFEIRLPKTF